MQQDFTKAEELVAGRFRNRNVIIPREALTVNDLLGFKIVGDSEMLEQFPILLSQTNGFTLLETERHAGDYNAVNLLNN